MTRNSLRSSSKENAKKDTRNATPPRRRGRPPRAARDSRDSDTNSKISSGAESTETSADLISSSSSSSSSSKVLTCILCNKNKASATFETDEDLQVHYASAHFKDRLSKLLPGSGGAAGFKCPKCTHAAFKERGALLEHYGVKHNVVQKLLEEFNKQQKSVEKNGQAPRRSQRGKKDVEVIDVESDEEEEEGEEVEEGSDGSSSVVVEDEVPAPPKRGRRKRSPVKGQQECKICHIVVPDRTKLKKHAIDKHFKTEIVNDLSKTKPFRCPLCKYIGDTFQGLFRHYGSVHHVIEKFMSQVEYSEAELAAEQEEEQRKAAANKAELWIVNDKKEEEEEEDEKGEKVKNGTAESEEEEGEEEEEEKPAKEKKRESRNVTKKKGRPPKRIQYEAEEPETGTGFKDLSEWAEVLNQYTNPKTYDEFKRQVHENLRTLDGRHATAISDREIRCICGKVVRLCNTYYWKYLVQKPTLKNGRIEQRGHWYTCQMVKEGGSFIPRPYVSQKELDDSRRKFSTERSFEPRVLEKRVRTKTDGEDADDESDEEEEEDEDASREGRRIRAKRVLNNGSDDCLPTKRARDEFNMSKHIRDLINSRQVNETFLQDGPCFMVAADLPMCHMCKGMSFEARKELVLKGEFDQDACDISCCFFAFRKLKCCKGPYLVVAGYLDPDRDPQEIDCNLWDTNPEAPPFEDVEKSKFILSLIGDQFCDMVLNERKCLSLHMSPNKNVVWKPAVKGVREMCDVCKTTLFNYHWICGRCGLFICLDCYQVRKSGLVRERESFFVDTVRRDEFNWPMCGDGYGHYIEQLMIAQIIPKNHLVDMGNKLHRLRAKFNISQFCHKPEEFAGLFSSDDKSPVRLQKSPTSRFVQERDRASKNFTCGLCEESEVFKWQSILYKHACYKHFYDEVFGPLTREAPFSCPEEGCKFSGDNRTRLGLHYGITHKVVVKHYEAALKDPNFKKLPASQPPVPVVPAPPVSATPSQPFKCPLCALIVSPTLKHDHLSSHFKDRLVPDLPTEAPFACPKCRYIGLDHSAIVRHYGGFHGMAVKYLIEHLTQKGEDASEFKYVEPDPKPPLLEGAGVECRLCEMLTVLRSNMDFYRHLSESHFRSILLEEVKHVPDEKPFKCPRADCQLSFNTRNQLVNHIGVGHRVVVKRYYELAGIKEDWQVHDIIPKTRETRDTCVICREKHIKVSMIFHLAQTHFKEQCSHLPVKVPFSCPICPHISEHYGGLLKHFGMYHKKFDEFKAEYFKKTTEVQQETNAEKSNCSEASSMSMDIKTEDIKTETTDETNVTQNGEANNTVGTSSQQLGNDTKREFRCLMCDSCESAGESSFELYKHLVETHFKEKILSQVVTGNLSEGIKHKCPTCGYAHSVKIQIARHMGIKHRLARQYYEEVTQIKIEENPEDLMPKGSSSYLLAPYLDKEQKEARRAQERQNSYQQRFGAVPSPNQQQQPKNYYNNQYSGHYQNYPPPPPAQGQEQYPYPPEHQDHQYPPSQYDPYNHQGYPGQQPQPQQYQYNHQQYQRPPSVDQQHYPPPQQSFPDQPPGYPPHQVPHPPPASYDPAYQQQQHPPYQGFQESQSEKECRICGIKVRGQLLYLKHLAEIHFKRKLMEILPYESPLLCPWEGCNIEKQSRLDLAMHYGVTHKAALGFIESLTKEEIDREIYAQGQQCRICQKCFLSVWDLMTHLSADHFSAQLDRELHQATKCPRETCNRVFSDRRSLRIHYGCHHKMVLPHFAAYLSVPIQQVIQMLKQENRTSVATFTPCCFCGKLSQSDGDHRKHMVLHLRRMLFDQMPEQPPFHCRHCSKVEPSQMNLLMHFAIAHPKIIDDILARDPNTLSIDMSFLEEEYKPQVVAPPPVDSDPYEPEADLDSRFPRCQLCDYRYFTRLDLCRHFVDNHLRSRLQNCIDAKTNKCPVCPMTYNKPQARLRHFIWSHQDLEGLVVHESQVKLSQMAPTTRDIDLVTQKEQKEKNGPSTGTLLEELTDLAALPITAMIDVKCVQPRCELCGENFADSMDKLRDKSRHLLNHFREQLLRELPAGATQCPKCPFVARDVNDLIKHYGLSHKVLFHMMQRELGDTWSVVEESFVCKLCHQAFMNTKFLTDHYCGNHFYARIAALIQSEHEPFQCPYCAYTAKSKLPLVRHLGFKHELVRKYLSEGDQQQWSQPAVQQHPQPQQQHPQQQQPYPQQKPQPPPHPQYPDPHGYRAVPSGHPVTLQQHTPPHHHQIDQHHQFYPEQQPTPPIIGKEKPRVKKSDQIPYACPICNSHFLNSQHLLRHASDKHFQDRLLADLPAQEPFRCPVPSCAFEGKDAKGLARHYGIDHKIVVRIFNEQQGKQNCYDESVLSLFESKNQREVCPVCQNNFGNHYLLLRHLADCHFRERICNGMEQNGVYKCPLCDHVSKDRQGFARHYGLVHRMVQELLKEIGIHDFVQNPGQQKKKDGATPTSSGAASPIKSQMSDASFSSPPPQPQQQQQPQQQHVTTSPHYQNQQPQQFQQPSPSQHYYTSPQNTPAYSPHHPQPHQDFSPQHFQQQPPPPHPQPPVTPTQDQYSQPHYPPANQSSFDQAYYRPPSAQSSQSSDYNPQFFGEVSPRPTPINQPLSLQQPMTPQPMTPQPMTPQPMTPKSHGSVTPGSVTPGPPLTPQDTSMTSPAPAMNQQFQQHPPTPQAFQEAAIQQQYKVLPQQSAAVPPPQAYPQQPYHEPHMQQQPMMSPGYYHHQQPTPHHSMGEPFALPSTSGPPRPKPPPPAEKIPKQNLGPGGKPAGSLCDEFIAPAKPGTQPPFRIKCAFCTAMAKSRSDFYRHVSERHFEQQLTADLPPTPPFKCPKCEYETKDKCWSPLIRHYGVAHKMVHQYIAGKIVGEVVSANASLKDPPGQPGQPGPSQRPDGSDYQLPDTILINGSKEGSRPTSSQGYYPPPQDQYTPAGMAAEEPALPSISAFFANTPNVDGYEQNQAKPQQYEGQQQADAVAAQQQQSFVPQQIDGTFDPSHGSEHSCDEVRSLPTTPVKELSAPSSSSSTPAKEPPTPTKKTSPTKPSPSQQQQARPKHCEMCGKMFTGKNRSMLKTQHIVHHFGDRLYLDLQDKGAPFKCPMENCEYATKHKPDWARHYGSVHKLIDKYMDEFFLTHERVEPMEEPLNIEPIPTVGPSVPPPPAAVTTAAPPPIVETPIVETPVTMKEFKEEVPEEPPAPKLSMQLPKAQLNQIISTAMSQQAQLQQNAQLELQKAMELQQQQQSLPPMSELKPGDLGVHLHLADQLLQHEADGAVKDSPWFTKAELDTHVAATHSMEMEIMESLKPHGENLQELSTDDLEASLGLPPEPELPTPAAVTAPPAATSTPSTSNVKSASRPCELCGYELKTKNKSRERQDHLARKHFREQIERDLAGASQAGAKPNVFFKCPLCEYEGKDRQTIYRHYTGKHKVLEEYLSQMLATGKIQTSAVTGQSVPSRAPPPEVSSASAATAILVNRPTAVETVPALPSFQATALELLNHENENRIDGLPSGLSFIDDVSTAAAMMPHELMDSDRIMQVDGANSGEDEEESEEGSSKPKRTFGPCPICGEDMKMNKQYHMAKRHFKAKLEETLPSEKPFVCPLCSAEVKNKINLWTHYLGKHRYTQIWAKEVCGVDISEKRAASSSAVESPQKESPKKESPKKESPKKESPKAETPKTPVKEEEESNDVPSSPEKSSPKKRAYTPRRPRGDLESTHGQQRRPEFWCDVCQKSYDNTSKPHHFAVVHFGERLRATLPASKPHLCPFCKYEAKHFLNLSTHYLGKHGYLDIWIREELEKKVKEVQPVVTSPPKPVVKTPPQRPARIHAPVPRVVPAVCPAPEMLKIEPEAMEVQIHENRGIKHQLSSSDEYTTSEDEINPSSVDQTSAPEKAFVRMLTRSLNPQLLEPIKIKRRRRPKRFKTLTELSELEFRDRGKRSAHYSSKPTSRDDIPVRVMSNAASDRFHGSVPHYWLCGGHVLVLDDPTNDGNIALFQESWIRGQPVIVANVSHKLDIENLWSPNAFSRQYGHIRHDIINTHSGRVIPKAKLQKFWDGFENLSERMLDDVGKPMSLKLKDWPPDNDFASYLPDRFTDLMKWIPLQPYTRREGRYNLASAMPSFFVRPDLGPKMYIAYGNALYPEHGTTNLHIDMSDACNVMVYVGIPKDGCYDEHFSLGLKAVDEADCDSITKRRVRDQSQVIGAIWHIYHPRDADKIRDLLHRVSIERGKKIEPHTDPIHDQSIYLDNQLRKRLYEEYGVIGYAFPQCEGDTVFIPAGAPHQVRNVHNCIKVAEDFVSPENLEWCFFQTEEFRHLSDTHTNHEDKLQIKNMLFHAVKDCLSVLEHHERAQQARAS